MWSLLKILLIGTAVISSSTPAIAPEEPIKTPISLKQRVAELPPIMQKIAWCESGHRQFDENGEVLRGRQNPQDVGLFQINEYYHLEDSKKLGYDIYTIEGNIAYALYLYQQQGTTPWNWSRECWG